MLNEYYAECRTLPAINETFPQFSRPISLLSPLDLSLRAGNIIPITPPTTPSPPRKRQRFMSDENYLWRPHVMETLPLHPHPPHPPPPLPPLPSTMPDSSKDTSRDVAAAATATATRVPSTAADESYFSHLTTGLKCPFERAGRGVELQDLRNNNKNNLHNESHNSYDEIPESQRSVLGHRRTTTTHPHPHNERQGELLDTIYLDDDTIVLTEDEEDETTLVGSHQDLSGFAEEDVVENESEAADEEDDDGEAVDEAIDVDEAPCNRNKDDEDDSNGSDGSQDEDVYVDILSNDDDELDPVRLKQRQIIEAELEAERAGAILTRNKLVYDNEELHNQAVNGLAKLFERDFGKVEGGGEKAEGASSDLKTNPPQNENNKIYTNLDEVEVRSEKRANEEMKKQSDLELRSAPTIHRPHKAHKLERKRMKMRKYLGMDEETISPVSGTIIRKLRDDEELVVRKGDIDPAFNVVEITEEAKAILASIDNKIGAYLCQLCRTLYDDAFMLAQHRCPRIVHIEYKCSECEKVFNCPANLASHRRWHKPKSELLANKQGAKRQHVATAISHVDGGMTHDKLSNDESVEGIFPCPQCGKTFRRHAYLKKHQASHQMLENLKSLDIFKHHNTSTPPFGFPQLHSHTATQHHPQTTHHNHNHHHHPHYQPPTPTLFNANQRHFVGHYQPSSAAMLQHHQQQQQQHQSIHNHKMASTNPAQLQRFPTSAFNFPHFDHQRRFYTLGELYLSQQLERSSAFQYVQQANHLRNLTTAVGNLLPTPATPPRPLMHPTLMSLPVK